MIAHSLDTIFWNNHHIFDVLPPRIQNFMANEVN